MIDYELLRVIWWCLVGVLLIGFAVTDGFDLGVGALLTLIGKAELAYDAVGRTGMATKFGLSPQVALFSPRGR